MLAHVVTAHLLTWTKLSFPENDDALAELLNLCRALHLEGRSCLDGVHRSGQQSIDMRRSAVTGQSNLVLGNIGAGSGSKECRCSDHVAEVFVNDIDYSQPTCSDSFRNGTPLQRTIHDFDEGHIDPLSPPFPFIEVMCLQKECRYKTKDHRRLYCFKASRTKSMEHCKFYSLNTAMSST